MDYVVYVRVRVSEIDRPLDLHDAGGGGGGGDSSNTTWS